MLAIHNLLVMFPYLTDKHGVKVRIDDVIYDNEDYYRVTWDAQRNEVRGLSCTAGYLHNIDQDTLAAFERIGRYKNNEHLFECD